MAMTVEQKLVYKKIDKLLWIDWDPIGVNDNEDARDEYQSYTPQIFNLKTNGADKETIAKYLYKIEAEDMGMVGNIDNCRKIAAKIVDI